MTAKPVKDFTPQRVALFWAKVDRLTPGECWEWTAYRNAGGYGMYCIGRAKYRAHRLAYFLVHGEPAAGLDLDHLCRNRACVNPSHLEPVSRQENLRRGIGHGSETHCPSGHSYADAYIERVGSRRCRPCSIERGKANYLLRRAVVRSGTE
jgi:hypothetical protein